jgi:hypothetical protein
MKIVLFGAGASCGCGDVDPCPPPLGADLYDVLARLFPISWGAVPDDAKNIFRSNFEEGMQILIERHGHAVAPLMQHMAIFFSRFGIADRASNLYIRFFQYLSANELIEQTIVSTINYECLCERAANIAGLQIGYFTSPISDKKVTSIWKLHGSCNFKLIGLEATRGVSFSGVGVAFNGGIEAINPLDVARIYQGNTSLYPSMSLYAKNKPITMAPSILHEKQSIWTTQTLNAEVISVIGVRPNPEDAHIWKPIAESNGKFCYIGNRADYDLWVNNHRQGKINKYLGRSWESGFDECNAHLT